MERSDVRAAVGAMLAGLDGNLDVLVPRGGKSLVARVQADTVAKGRQPMGESTSAYCQARVALPLMRVSSSRRARTLPASCSSLGRLT